MEGPPILKALNQQEIIDEKIIMNFSNKWIRDWCVADHMGMSG